jgi:hypothetical protein
MWVSAGEMWVSAALAGGELFMFPIGTHFLLFALLLREKM